MARSCGIYYVAHVHLSSEEIWTSPEIELHPVSRQWLLLFSQDVPRHTYKSLWLFLGQLHYSIHYQPLQLILCANFKQWFLLFGIQFGHCRKQTHTKVFITCCFVWWPLLQFIFHYGFRILAKHPQCTCVFPLQDQLECKFTMSSTPITMQKKTPDENIRDPICDLCSSSLRLNRAKGLQQVSSLSLHR